MLSGHSKWSTIKRKKGAADAKRGKLFTRLGKEITIAARDGGGDPSMNPALRSAVESARGQNMPKDTIERAIKRGTGEIEGARYEEITYEGYGHGGVAILVQTVTENINRTAAEIRHAFSKNGGKMADPGSVSYLFETKGIFQIDPEVADEEQVMEVVIDAGAEDVAQEDDAVVVTTPREGFHAVSSALEGAGIATLSAEISPVPSTTIQVEGDNARGLLKLITVLDDLDDTQSVSANFDIPDEEFQALQEEL